jgi:hypothetical protein
MDSAAGNITKKFSWAAFKAAFIGTTHAWTKSQSITPVEVTSSSAHIAVDASLSNVFTHTFTENTTLDNPSNLVAGQTIIIQLTQHASSPKTLAFGSAYKFVGAAPTITATNSAKDTLICTARSSSLMDCVSLLNITA